MLVFKRYHINGNAGRLGKRRGIFQTAGGLIAIREKENARSGIARLRCQRHAYPARQVGRLHVADVTGERHFTRIGWHGCNDRIARHRHRTHPIFGTLLASNCLTNCFLCLRAQGKRNAVA